MKTEYDFVAICTYPNCGQVGTANVTGKLISTASHHAWSHHHTVEVYRRDLEHVGTIDHEGKMLQLALF